MVLAFIPLNPRVCILLTLSTFCFTSRWPQSYLFLCKLPSMWAVYVNFHPHLPLSQSSAGHWQPCPLLPRLVPTAEVSQRFHTGKEAPRGTSSGRILPPWAALFLFSVSPPESHVCVQVGLQSLSSCGLRSMLFIFLKTVRMHKILPVSCLCM